MTPRVVLVSGANGGLGRAVAEAFLADTASHFVWLAVHRNRGHADALVAAHPDRAACVDLDVTQPGSWGAAVQTILDRQRHLDVLVNNAGFHEDSLLATMAPDSWQRVLDVNLSAVFHGCQAVLPAMINRRHGRIVNVASLSALLAPAGQTNYAAAKAGVIALTQSLAKEVARIGITVNAVCPGYIDTESLAALGPEARQAALTRVPMRRFGTPAEVAAAVRFLACPEAAYITGSVLKIDGGIL
jgi:3-oxoacyl-[acyl-carrier protein] reductase